MLPGEAARWQKLEAEFRKHCASYGYGEIRTPVFEHTELFERAVGPGSDIVRKEMYTFVDKGGRSITLRAEGTAPAVRAFLENHLDAAPQPTKLYYICPVFRHERPQAGRLRQHHQMGIEIFGAGAPSADAEVIALGWFFMWKMGLRRHLLMVNSIGCPRCRPRYRERLVSYFSTRIGELCGDCCERFKLNPLRILDCKVPSCRELGRGAPAALDHLCEECGQHFRDLKGYLESLGIPYRVETTLVRGLDYYTRTVFEIVHGELGAQSAVCAGGRYDGLVEECGGPSVPGVGFGMGMERLLLALNAEAVEGFTGEPQARQDIFCLVAVAGSSRGVGDAGGKLRKCDKDVKEEERGGEALRREDRPLSRDHARVASCEGSLDRLRLEAWRLLFRLREEGIPCDLDHAGRSLKGQMKYAEKAGARYVVLLGEDELGSGEATLRDMGTGRQERIPLGELPAALRKRLC